MSIIAHDGGCSGGRARPHLKSRPAMALKEAAIRRAKPANKPCKVADSLGLYPDLPRMDVKTTSAADNADDTDQLSALARGV